MEKYILKMTGWNEWGENIPTDLGFDGVPDALDRAQKAQDTLYKIHIQILAELPTLEISLEMYDSFKHDPDFVAIAGFAAANRVSYFTAEIQHYDEKKFQRDNAAKARIDSLRQRIDEMMRSR